MNNPQSFLWMEEWKKRNLLMRIFEKSTDETISSEQFRLFVINSIEKFNQLYKDGVNKVVNQTTSQAKQKANYNISNPTT